MVRVHVHILSRLDSDDKRWLDSLTLMVNERLVVMNLGKRNYTDKTRRWAINQVIDLVKQGLRTRGDIAMAGGPFGADEHVESEVAIKWAEEEGQVVEVWDGTLVTAEEFHKGYTIAGLSELIREDLGPYPEVVQIDPDLLLDLKPSQEIGERLAIAPTPLLGMVQVPLADLIGLKLEGRCSMDCKLPLEECVQFHYWVFKRQRLKYRGTSATTGSKHYTGYAPFVELMRGRISRTFTCQIRHAAGRGKYETALLLVDGRLPAYLNNPPEESPDEDINF